jgi:hypothetical protein
MKKRQSTTEIVVEMLLYVAVGAFLGYALKRCPSPSGGAPLELFGWVNE